MFSRKLTYKKIPLLLFLLAVVFFVMSIAGNNTGDNTQEVAQKAEASVIKRAAVLDKYVDQVLASEPRETPRLQIPEDLVIYRYVNDSLAAWINQFPIINDDISNRMMIQRLSNFRVSTSISITQGPDCKGVWYHSVLLTEQGSSDMKAGNQPLNQPSLAA